MKQKDQLTIRMLRSLVFLMLMMLAPIGAWAVDYGLTVAGVQVTDVNASNVLGDEIKSVSYDNTNHILTLRGANISYIDTSAIVVGEDISALTIHLVGNSTISTGDFSVISFANANSSLTVITSEVLPGSLDAAKFAWNITPVYQNGLTYSNGTIGASLDNTEISLFTGRDTYANTDNGDNSYIYSSFAFYASYATNVDGNHFVKVSTKESATTAAMWPSSLNNPGLVEKVTLQFGACTNNDITVQVKGLDNEGNADGKTYSGSIALSTANTDGIIEIPVENVTSDNLLLQFSSASSFSFFPITIAFTRSPVKIGGGIGTSDDPFLIKTAGDLKTLSEYINNGTVSNEACVKLYDDIDCSELEGFNPIGSSDYSFNGTFDGNNKVISNLTVTGSYGISAGLFGRINGSALVKDLTLDHCTVSGGVANGAVVGYMSSGTVQNSTLTNNCSVSTSGDVSSPSCGGIVGYAQGGTVSNCVVNGCTITATTTTDDGVPYAGGIIGDTNGAVTISGCEVSGTVQAPTIISSTHNESYAGGIVANCEGTAAEGSATITGCSVKGKVTVSAEDQSYESAFAGAIAGSPYEATLTSNTYEYSVKTSTKTFDETNETTVTTEKEGYEQRGIGGLEITDITGAVMYTKVLTLPAESLEGNVMSALDDNPTTEGGYYHIATEGYGFLVAPGQPVYLKVMPSVSDGCSLSSISVTYGTNQTAEITLTNEEDGELFYTITEMPDADATLNVTFTTSYDLWIGETQVTSENAAHILGENNTSVTFTSIFDNATEQTINTLTLNGATLTVPVKVGLDNLTIDIQGENTITTDVTCIQKKDNTDPLLTFKSTSDEVGSLTLSNTSQSENGVMSSDYFGKFTISKELALILYRSGYTSETYYFTAGEVHNAQLVPSYGVQVGNMQVYSGNATNVLNDEGTPTVVFDAEHHKLTLNGASISGAISTSLENLTIELVGNNSIYQESSYATLQSSTGDAVTMTIQSTGATTGSLTMNQAYTQAGTFADAHVTLDITAPLQVISGSLTGNTTNDNTVVIGASYGLYIANTEVTSKNASNVLNDGTVSYDAANNILTLNSANLYGDGKNIVYSGSANLTIALNGSCYVNSIVYEGQGATIPNLMLKKVEGALPGTTLRTPSDFRTSFSEVNYQDWLGLKTEEISQTTYYDVTSKTPSIYGSWNGLTDKWEVSVTSKFEGTVKYSLTYVDENLAANNKTNEPFVEAFTLLGPATIKATITIDNEVSPEETAYYFGVMPNPLRFEYDGETAPTFAATLYPSVEGVTLTPQYSPGSFATFSEGNVTINGFGSGLAYAGLNLPDNRTFSVITDSIAFRMEVVPPAPTISPDEGEIASTATISLTSTVNDATIKYKWDNGTAETYTEPLQAQNGTLTAWVELVYDQATGATVSSDEATATYALSYALDVAFMGSNTWATYYGTENLTVPEGLTAYAVSGVNETTGVVSVEAIGYIPANKAILLQRKANGAANGYTATAYTGQTTDITSMLQGTSQAASIEDMLGATVYVLYNDAFVKATSGTIPANRAYLVLGAMTTPNVNAPQMLTLDGGTTGIHSIENEELTIDNVYDLSGRKLSGKPSKSGLYIKNGKKVVVNK